MPTLDDVYRKFGETAEAAQLFETELGNMLLEAHVVEENLVLNKNPARAADILASVNHHTIGKLLTNLKNHTQSLDALEGLLWKAVQERNRLFHSYYRTHNFRRNSEEGRIQMMQDLDVIHHALLDAYKAVMKLSGVDLEAAAEKLVRLPTRQLPI